MNPLLELRELGQSVWYDDLRRGLITSGELQRMVSDYGITGITSNPTIFEKAISGSTDYDHSIKELIGQGLDEGEILRHLFSEDIKMGADIFLPVYEGSGGRDGFVSVEVSPRVARSVEDTIDEAKKLHSLIGRQNVMIKVPATREGITSLELLISEGYNINVTLLFSVERYREIALAYIRGMERRLKEGKPLDSVSSVASFFISRIDTAVDSIIEGMILSASGKDRRRLTSLLGRTAIANAKLAYREYMEIFHGERFRHLLSRGARPQRLLWASTGVKNPRYSDVKYVDGLIGRETVNTMPLKTLLAFLDHGKVKETLTEGMEEAERVMEDIASIGIDMEDVTERLEEEGIEKFLNSFNNLMECISMRKKIITSGRAMRISYKLNDLESPVRDTMERLKREDFPGRLWNKDPTLWKKDEPDRGIIKNALGWVTVPDTMEGRIEELVAFGEEIKEEGYRDVVLLGMGGSSLAPLVLSRTFPPKEGYPELKVLDSTDPVAIMDIDTSIDPERTLFIVSSKSGTTIEPLTLFEYFFKRVSGVVDKDPGRNFIAITDPDTPLVELSERYRFRRTFVNPPDIGGRFSALSYFGLVPAVVKGIDISRLLFHAGELMEATQPCVPVTDNPAIILGSILGLCAAAGRDKATIFTDRRISSFGLWIEQLLAESTGKEGKGIIPITGEPPGKPEVYGDDRLFVSLELPNSEHGIEETLHGLERRGHPVVRIYLNDVHELGGGFYMWEVATAVAGSIIGINPFDQPDVEDAKRRTRMILKGFEKGERPSSALPVVAEGDGFSISIGRTMAEALRDGFSDAVSCVRASLGLLKKGDYIGILAYFNPNDHEIEGIFTDIRLSLRDSTGCATQFGYGPRYLHSTGQLHKGGPKRSLFMVFLHQDTRDLKIPARGYTFRELELSQGLGDVDTLDARGRRVLLFHLHGDAGKALREVKDVIRAGMAL